MEAAQAAPQVGLSADQSSAQTGRQTSSHVVRLDGVRGFAVLAVLLQHAVNIGQKIPVGQLGVQLFFVLSGFLITGILLRCRKRVRSGEVTLGQELKNFYARRALRIFPLFYLVLILVTAFGLPHMRERFIWDAFYLNNIYFPLTHSAAGALDQHFWSLAVEEHFYLAWPLLMILAPDRLVIRVAVAPIILCAIFRVIACAAGGDFSIVMNMTPTAMDALGWGALLAVITTQEFSHPRLLALVDRLGLWLGVPAMLAYLAFAHRFNMWTYVIFGTFTPLFFFWLVDFGRVGGNGRFSRLLAWKPLVFTGVISYGLYMYHIYVNFLLDHGMPRSIPEDWHRYLRAVLMIPCSFVVAIISYYLFERPILSLKKHFNY
jgi:peptidoglycan/LPS O-acetylase OafA/YrhL